jgi:hypothetical protein
MKNLLKGLLIIAGLAILAVIATMLLMPWMDRWGANDSEIAASYPGDELVPNPAFTYNRAVTINASPEEIYPWIIQLGAERGGYYSYEWLETSILQCPMTNAARIHEEWQDLKVGDVIKMCPGDFGPPPYQVAQLLPDQAMVLGHQDNGVWSDTWQFILVTQTEDTTRLVLRSRDTKTGGIWDVIRPGVFIMERGMLLGIKQRADS